MRRSTGTLCACAPVGRSRRVDPRRLAPVEAPALPTNNCAVVVALGAPDGRADVVRGRWHACPGVSRQETAKAWAIGVGLAELAGQMMTTPGRPGHRARRKAADRYGSLGGSARWHADGEHSDVVFQPGAELGQEGGQGGDGGRCCGRRYRGGERQQRFLLEAAVGGPRCGPR